MENMESTKIVGTYFTERTVHRPTDLELKSLGEAAVRKLRQSRIEPFILEIPHGMSSDAIDGAVLYFDKKQYRVRASSSDGIVQSTEASRYWLFAQPSREQQVTDDVARLAELAALNVDTPQRQDIQRALRIFGEGILRLAREHLFEAGMSGKLEVRKSYARQSDGLLGQIVDRLSGQGEMVEKAGIDPDELQRFR